jgi:LL-diaminopimelate aminotransferase
MTFPKASRVRNLPPYPFAVLGQRIKQLNANGGKPIIRMDVGSPDLPPPDFVINKLAEVAARPDVHGYSGYRGIPVFRQAVADYYQKRFNVNLDPDNEVLPLLGSKEGIVNLALATVNDGDVVLLPSLAYPAYIMGTMLAGADIYEMPITTDNGYFPVFEDIPQDVVDRAKLMWLSYPNNPTGATVDFDRYEAAVQFCRENGILLAFDNPYLEITYDGAPAAPSIMQVDGAMETAVEFTSLSKTYNMAGWRIGAMVGPAEIIDTLLLIKSNVDSGHFHAVYEAAALALNETSQSWIDERNQRYEVRRDKIIEALPNINLELELYPAATLYIWAKVPNGDDIDYHSRVLEGARVSITPGSFYGKDGRGYMRFSLGISDHDLDEALSRLREYWAKQ